MIYVKPEFIKENPQALIIDCRFNMAMPNLGKQNYDNGHLDGAVYVDLDKDMMGKLQEHGGRHPMPNMDEFRLKMENVGISDETVVIIYDDGLFPSSARLWFMLQVLGKESYIVDGGYAACLQAGLDWNKDIVELKKGSITSQKQEDLIVDIDYVLKAIKNDKVAIVDSRANDRYLGLNEPIDRIAGRIPSAINIFWKDSFNGTFIKSREELEKIFSQLDSYDEVIFYCGSGVTGAVNLMMYKELGKKSKLYAGSYSDYISYKNVELIIKDSEKIVL